MSEPTNPLFEEEKEFLERKKLEYERALRGDVEHIKDQTANVGKLALIGAGAATGIWLLVKAFRGRKPHKEYSERDGRGQHERGYASGRDGRYDQGYGMAYDEQPGSSFFDFDDDDERWVKHEPTRFEDGENDEADENFNPEEMMARGRRAHEQEKARAPRRNNFVPGSERGEQDDNGLSQYPNFPAHSSRQHGNDSRGNSGQSQPDYQPSEGFYFTDDDDFGYSEPGGRLTAATDRGYAMDEPLFDTAAGRDAKNTSEPARNRPFYHPDHSHPTANQTPGNSRSPESDGFQNLTADQNPTTTAARNKSQDKPQPKPGATLGSMLLSFAASDNGRALLGQAAAIGMALFGKALKDRMPQEPLTAPTLPGTADSADLAASTSPAARAGQPSSAPDASSADLAATADFSDDTAR